MSKSKPRVLVLFNAEGPTTLDRDYSEDLKKKDWETERDISRALHALDYPYELLGVFDDPTLIIEKVKRFKPDMIFNLVERFNNDAALDQNIPSFLELLSVAYTGCGPKGLMLCKNKAITKKILSFHHIPVPNFSVLHRGKIIRRPKRMAFPIIVKPLREEASLGISQASLVDDDQQFEERARFIHETMSQDVIAEEYIEGRELYVSVIGNKRLNVLPVRELKFREVPADEPKFATYRAKWDKHYQERWGIKNEFPDPLPQGAVETIQKYCKKAYRLLWIRGYARLDLRLRADGRVYIIEANPNPMLAREEDFAESAAKGGLAYPQLIKKIIQLGLDHPLHES